MKNNTLPKNSFLLFIVCGALLIYNSALGQVTGATGPAGPGYLATSNSSVAIGTGSKTFTTQSGLAYLPGDYVRISASAADYIEGTITSYSGATLVISEVLKAGTGTFTSWNIGEAGKQGTKGIAGATGPAGAAGVTGPTGSQGLQGVTGNNGATGSAGITGPTGPAGSANGWALTGNAGTVSGTDYIGTSDNVDLMFKVKGIQAGIIETVNTNNSTALGASSLLSETANHANHSAAFGYEALELNTTGLCNTATGFEALLSNSTGNYNTANGCLALSLNSTGSNNTAIGLDALSKNIAGSSNTAVGQNSLWQNTTGNYNVGVGSGTLYANIIASQNTAFGYNALVADSSGGSNTAVGYSALKTNKTGTSNTAIGSGADVGSNSLTNATSIGAGAIATTSNSMVLGTTGTAVCIGTSTPATGFILNVAGNVICEELQVEAQASWPDYVFDKNYKLMSIQDLETSIQANKHLPNLPPACEVEEKGMKLGEMQSKIVEKLEEADLYIIQLEKHIETLEKQNADVQKQMNDLKQQLQSFKK